MIGLYGYDGTAGWRIVATVDGERRVLAWADPPEGADLAPFQSAAGYENVHFEPVADKAAELAAFPPYAGMA